MTFVAERLVYTTWRYRAERHALNYVQAYMKIYRIVFYLLILLFCLQACKGPSEHKIVNRAAPEAEQFIDSMLAGGRQGEDSIAYTIALTREKIKQYPPQKDEWTYAYLNLYLAQFYLKAENDSALQPAIIAKDFYETHVGVDATDTLNIKGLVISNFVYGRLLYIMNENVPLANYYLSKAASLCMLPSLSGMIKPAYRMQICMAAIASNRTCDQLEQALRYGHAALAIYQKVPGLHKPHYMQTLGDLAAAYSKKKQPDSAWHYITLLQHEIMPDPAHTDSAGLPVLHLVVADYYYNVQQYDSSLKYSLLSMQQEDEPEYSLIECSNNLGLCVRLKKKQEAAKWYTLCEKKANPQWQSLDITDKIAYLENKTAYQLIYGDKYKAEENYWELAALKDENYSRERLKMFTAVESEYNMAAKERKISVLNEKNKTFKKQQQNLILIIIFTLLAGLVLVAIISLLLKQRRLKEEKEKAELQQQLLRAQMEPHFIFNTLSAIQSSVRFDEKEKTLKYLNQFGRLLRSSLELSREPLVPLTDEVDALENYLSLQQMRFENAFHYQISVPPEEDMYAVHLPPMLIQPFVENAIVHGTDMGKGSGHITVTFEIKNSVLTVVITDSGRAKPVVNIRPEYPHKSLSVAITRERLQILAEETGLSAGIHMENRLSQGTTVTLTIPVSSSKKRF